MFSPMTSSNVVVSKSTAGTSRSRPAISFGTRILAMLSTVVLVYVLGDPMPLISRDAAYRAVVSWDVPVYSPMAYGSYRS